MALIAITSQERSEIEMKPTINKDPIWVTQGKTIKQLIEELQTFEDQDLEVRISLDEGETHKPISMVGKRKGFCMLMNCELED